MRIGTCFVGLSVLLLFLVISGCVSEGPDLSTNTLHQSLSPKNPGPSTATFEPDAKYGRGALLLSRFDSLSQLLDLIQVDYGQAFSPFFPLSCSRAYVQVTHESGGQKVQGVLGMGVSEGDFANARDGGVRERLALLIRSPYAVLKRKDLQRVYALSRWRDNYYGEGDIAFFDLAVAMTEHISGYDKQKLPEKEFGEKGFINTFNHLVAQAFMTTLFSERLAEFVADAHERHHMPGLITGNFTPAQINDIETGPTDNYLDMVNNEWGQEIGKALKAKYQITARTEWTPSLVRDYLNDIQEYCGHAFQIGFTPFFASDEVVIRFSMKIKKVLKDVPLMK